MDAERPPPPYETDKPPAYSTHNNPPQYTTCTSTLRFDENSSAAALSIPLGPYHSSVEQRRIIQLSASTHGPALGEPPSQQRTQFQFLRRSRDPRGNDDQHAESTGYLHSFPRWLRINLILTTWTVFLILIPTLCNFIFIAVARGALVDDPYDRACGNHFIAHASEPWDPSLRNAPPGSGRYHGECRRLYAWTQVTIAAGIFSFLRPLYQLYTVVTQRSQDAPCELRSSAHGIFFARSFASAVAAALYLVSALLLGTSRLMTGPPTEGEWYRPMYSVCLALVCANFAASAHQAIMTALASYMLLREKRLARRTAGRTRETQQM